MNKTFGDYILFIDESGKSEFSDNSDNFLLCGIILDRNLHSALSNYMVSLKNKSDISISENIHAFDLFEDEFEAERFKKNRIPCDKIKIFFERLMRITEGVDMYCLIFRINKEPYLKSIKKVAEKKNSTERAVIRYLRRNNLHDFLYESLARRMILEFGHFLETTDAQGEIVAESRRQGDEAVLRAFLTATQCSTFSEDSKYRTWSVNSFKRIHSLTFQNKKGLSFGLEIADLFGWAHFNSQYGRRYPLKSNTKKVRVERRLLRVNKIMPSFYRKKPEDISRIKLKTIAEDRVSEFTKKLNDYKAFGLFGDPTR